MRRVTLVAVLAVTAAWAAQDAVTVKAKTLQSGVKGKWAAEVTYPVVRGGGALGAFAGKVVAEQEGRRYRAFVTEAKDFYRKPAFMSAGWSYESTTRLRRNSPGVLSFKTESYQFEGGAHGIGLVRTYTFGFVGGKPKRLTIDDVIGGRVARRELEMRLLQKAVDTPGTDWIENGDVKNFTQEQLDRFWVSGEGLVFEFDPYELGSYASGPFTFKMSWAELKGIVRRDGPLKSLL